MACLQPCTLKSGGAVCGRLHRPASWQQHFACSIRARCASLAYMCPACVHTRILQVAFFMRLCLELIPGLLQGHTSCITSCWTCHIALCDLLPEVHRCMTPTPSASAECSSTSPAYQHPCNDEAGLHPALLTPRCCLARGTQPRAVTRHCNAFIHPSVYPSIHAAWQACAFPAAPCWTSGPRWAGMEASPLPSPGLGYGLLQPLVCRV